MSRSAPMPLGTARPAAPASRGRGGGLLLTVALASGVFLVVVLAHLAMMRVGVAWGAEVPIALRAVGATVALGTGVLKLASFLGKRQAALLVVGVAFLGVGLVEAGRVVALLAATTLDSLSPLVIAGRSGWAAGTALPLLLTLGMVLVRPGSSGARPRQRGRFVAVAALVVVAGVVGPWLDLLPGSVVAGTTVARPGVAWTIALYLLTFALLWRRRDVSGTLDGRWLGFALYVGFLDQALIAPFWVGVGTGAGAVDAMLKLATYLIAAAGVLVHTTLIARSQDAAVARFRHEALERRRVEEELARQAARLAHANEELSQYAYLASHDLQEPLRMVTNYLQLIERRYADALDDDGREFIGFAVDGARRMKRLTNDLLAYSRLDDAPPASDEPTSANDAFDAAVRNLEVLIGETGAEVTRGDLPDLPVERTRLTQLFQNLIGNALKFRRENVAPRVHAEAERRGASWRFTVADNGIGIDEKYHDRVFGVFQRLHRRDAFPGSGIGLALCRKIVEGYGGGIGFESEPGEGTTFAFTIPVRPERRPAPAVADPELTSHVSGLIDRARELT